jgi:phosphonate transport system substrate-binding protein
MILWSRHDRHRRRGRSSCVVAHADSGEISLARIFGLAVLAGVCAAGAAAQGSNVALAVTEGVTYQATPNKIRHKFAPLAKYIGKATGKHVRIVLVPADDDLRAGLTKPEYDLAFVQPAHVAMAAIKSGRYRAIGWTSGFTDCTVSLLVKADAPLKPLDGIRGNTMVTPDPDSITAVMVRAMCRTANLPTTDAKPPPPTAARVVTTRYQDAVPFYLDHRFAQVNATAARAVVKSWTDKGGKVLTQSRSVPIKQIIASTRMPAEEQDQIRDALVGMSPTKAGRDALETIGYKGFVAPNRDVENAAMAWPGL